MALTATIATQYNTDTDGDSFTTASVAPTSGGLYLVFVGGGVDPAGSRTPTLTGTNGWNTTWTRITTAHVVYAFGGTDRATTEAFWGVASSGTSGTLTSDFGAGTDLEGVHIHVVLIGGGPNTTAPVGAVGTNHDDSGGGSSITATLSATPATTSIVVAFGVNDSGAAISMSAGANYTLLGSTIVNGWGIAALEYWAAPTNTSVACSWPVADLLSISAVEILVAGAATRNLGVTVSPRRW